MPQSDLHERAKQGEWGLDLRAEKQRRSPETKEMHQKNTERSAMQRIIRPSSSEGEMPTYQMGLNKEN